MCDENRSDVDDEVDDDVDEEALRRAVAAPLVRAVLSAVDVLAREAAGEGDSQVNDQTFSTCVSLTRLAPALLKLGPALPQLDATELSPPDEDEEPEATVNEPNIPDERGQTTYEAEMSPNVTECHIAADRLNDKQLLAMKMMLAGNPDTEIVEKVGIHRRTLWRWRTHDDDFRSELKRRRRILCAEASDRLRSLLAPALDVMEWHLRDVYDRNRFRAASALLRLSNVRQTVQVGDDDDEDDAPGE